MTTYTPPNEVDFHFDVMCPWAYQTSLWMRDVRDQLDLKVNWKFFSLEEINLREGKKASVGAGMELWVVDDAHWCGSAAHGYGSFR